MHYQFLSDIRGRLALVVTAAALIFGFIHTEARADTTVANGDTAGLIAAINAANNNGVSVDTITLASNGFYSFTLQSGGGNALPAITTPINIVGNGATIVRDSVVATQTFRLFQVGAGGNLNLNSLTLRGGSSDLGGAVSVQSGGQVMLINVTAQNNQALGQNGSNFYHAASDSTYGSGGGAGLGGAVYVAFGAQAHLVNSTLSNNCAIGGDGGKGDYGDHGGGGGAALGGGLYLEGTAYLTNTSVLANEVIGGRGGQGGGVADIEPGQPDPQLNAPTSNCGQYVTKRSTTTGGRGGGALGGAAGGGSTAGNGGYASGGGAAVTGGKGGTPGGGGGASGEAGGNVAGRGGELGGSSYNPDYNEPRYGESRGGGIFNFKGNLTVNGGAVNANLTFRLSGINPVTLDGEGMGGGISNYLGNLTVNGATLAGNVSGDGSAMWTSGPATVSNANFNDNQANYAGGLYVKYNTASLNLSNSSFNRNTAGYDGGAIYVTSGPGVNVGPVVQITNTGFYSNTTTDGASQGGAISADSDYRITISNSTFMNNLAKTRGGAINGFSDNQSLITVTNSTFFSNTANNTPGAIGVDEGDMLYVANSTFVSNTRAIFVNTAGSVQFRLYNSLFVANTNHCNRNTNQSGNNVVFPATTANTTPTNCATAAVIATTSPVVVQAPSNNGGPTPTIPLLATATEAIDKANPTYCPPTDQRGLGRVGVCDIGSFELTGVNPPTNLQLSQPSPSQAQLTWTDNSNNETGFRIERNQDGNGWAQLTTVAANITNYTDNTLNATSVYSYRVQTLGATANSDYSNVVQTTPVPLAPTNLQLSQPIVFQIQLSWTDNSNNESGFRIERRENAGNWGVLTTVGANITNYTDNGITPSHVYTYRVQALSPVGNSDYSNEVQNNPVSGYDFVVTEPTDNGTNVPNSLSAALLQAQSGQTIWFNLKDGGTTVTINGTLPLPRSGVQIVGSCTTPITLDASAAPQTWQLIGGRLYGLNLKLLHLFVFRPPNIFYCVKVS